MQNEETNRIDLLSPDDTDAMAELQVRREALETEMRTHLVRPDGSPVPAHATLFTNDELVVIKDYTYRVAYINESSITFEPVGVVMLDAK